VKIAGASHLLHEDNAPDYNAAVLSFLARHRQTTRRARSGELGA